MKIAAVYSRLTCFALILRQGHCLHVLNDISRRQALLSASTAAATWLGLRCPGFADNDVVGVVDDLHSRDRNMNKNALIREDYWYMMGKTPPRLLSGPLKGDDPAFNAFGSCASDVGTENPCTYVSLKQRIPAYTKYGDSIAYGAKEMGRLGQVLDQLEKQPKDDSLWQQALDFVVPQERQSPPALVDAELKMILLATTLTTSAAFPTPSRELLVARFYANECHYASSVMLEAIHDRDIDRARAAWELGRDSWNSYFQVVNRSISPKVGEKFQAIA